MSEMARCVYCLGEFPKAEITVDHVIARSWYPKDTPGTITKWKAPACRKCNNEKSKIEKDMFERIALCIPTESPGLPDGLKKIAEKARRAHTPSEAETVRDFAHRFNKREALRNSIVPIPDPNGLGVVSAFIENHDRGSRHGMQVSVALDDLIKMWIRGVHYCEFDRYTSPEAKVESYMLKDEDAADVYKNMIQHARYISKGYGVEVFVCDASNKHKSITFYGFNIWQNFRTYGSVHDVNSARYLES